MLFFVVAIVLVGAANAVHNTTVKEVNTLIDHTIKKIILHQSFAAKYLGVSAQVTNIQHLARVGDCVMTAPLTFECHAAAPDALFKGLGSSMGMNFQITFSVVANAEGQLVKFEITHADVVPHALFEEYYLSLKSLWDKLKAAIMKLIFGKTKESTVEVQKEVGLNVFGTYINQ